MKSEKWFSRMLRQKSIGSGVRMWSFEWAGHATAPDLYCVAPERGGFWVELKVVPTDNCKIPFRPGQQQWLREHGLAGGDGCVMIYCNATSTIHYVAGAIAGSNFVRDSKLKDIPTAQFPTTSVGMTSLFLFLQRYRRQSAELIRVDP